MSAPVLLSERDGGVVTLTLNRPEAMNALSAELRTAIIETFTALQADATAECVILTGAGRAFCAGLDLKELGGETGGGASGLAAISNNQMVNAILAFDRPVIGAVNGVAITGGFELALACDILVCSTAARFADTHGRVGILPGWGLSQRLPRLIGINRARELSFTGNFLSAGEAGAWGLCSRVVAPEELMPLARKLADDIVSCDPAALRGIKSLINKGYETTLGEGLALESKRSNEHLAHVTPEMIAARRAAIQERARKQAGG